MDAICIHCKDSHNATQTEADICLKSEFTQGSEYTSSNVGIVIWFLQQDLKIHSEYLEECLIIIDEKLQESGNPDGWKDIDERKKMLSLEKEIIKSALSKDGYSSLEYETPLVDMLRVVDARTITTGKNALKNKTNK